MTTFFRLIPGAPRVDRATRNAAGFLPVRATKWCDAATTAAAWGHYLYPPMAFSACCSEGRIYWQYGRHKEWFPLQNAAQFPGFSETFDAFAPPALAGRAPPFLTALPEARVLQIWTGYFATTRPAESLWIGAPSNVPPHGRYFSFDGIIEPDRHPLPLFANIQLHGEPVHFSMNLPLIQARALPRAGYASPMNRAERPDALPADFWDAYGAWLEQKERAAAYAAAARQRRKRESV